MARKKTKTASKPRANKMVKKGTQSFNFKAAEMMEKDFRSTPTMIAAQYGKDLAMLRQQEKKLMNNLQKADSKHKTAKNKTIMLSNKSMNKKLIMASQKLEASLNQMVCELTTKLENVKSLCMAAAQQQAKFTSLNKQLASWEKEFAAKAKMEMEAKKKKELESKAKKAKAATTRVRKKKEDSMSPMSEECPSMMEEMMDQMPQESTDMNVEEEMPVAEVN